MDRRIDCTGADSVVTVSAVQIIITASINLMDEFIAITYLRSPVFFIAIVYTQQAVA